MLSQGCSPLATVVLHDAAVGYETGINVNGNENSTEPPSGRGNISPRMRCSTQVPTSGEADRPDEEWT